MLDTRRRVVVTGMGAVTAAGTLPGTLFDQVCAGQSGIRHLPDQMPASPIPMAAWIESGIDDDPKTKAHDRATQLALTAARLALTDAGVFDVPELCEVTGVYLGTGAGPIGTMDQTYHRLYAEGRDRVAPMTLPRTIHNAPASEIAIRYGLKGGNTTYSVACASSSSAIGEAMRAIRHGYSDRILAGGTEAMLNYGALHAWSALRAYATPADPIDASCRPFSADRDGLVMGEGSGFLVLESLESARARGATILAELVGYGVSCDAVHITHPDSGGQIRAIKAALNDAALEPEAVDYINAHATGTPVGDAVEAASLHAVFGNRMPDIPVSSTKAVHGHLMGAGGAVELIISLLALQQGCVPPTAHCRAPDMALGLDVVANSPRKSVINTVMSNSFAFGGSNVVLIAEKMRIQS